MPEPAPPTPPTPEDKLAHLRELIALHDHFWRDLYMKAPSRMLHTWLLHEWTPWYAGWTSFDEQGGAFDAQGEVRAGLIDELAGRLSQLREQAAARGILVPDIGSARRGFVDLAESHPWDSQLDARYQAGLRGDPPFPSDHQDTSRTSGDPMHPLIGKHGGGGGGHHHGGGGGGGRGRRRFFGGGGSYYPYPYPYPYQWPWWQQPYQQPSYGYDEEEEDVISGRGGMRGGMRGGGMGMRRGMRRRRRRQEQDFQDQDQDQGQQGELIPYVPQNGDPDEEPMTVSGGNELFALLPMLSPGAGGLSCKMDLGPDLQLRVEICVDGACYATAADLSGVLGQIANGVAAYHDRLHAGRAPAAQSPAAISEVATKADAAVEAAGTMLIGALYDQHVNSITAGWLDGLKRAALFAVAPVYAVHKEIAGIPEVKKTLRDYKGPISYAAGAVASAYGGPAGGAAAQQLTGPLIDHLTDQGGDAQQLIAGIQQASGGDPTVAKALEDAQKAVAHTTAAYHLAATAAKASEGDHRAGSKIAEVDEAASRGDAGAVQAMAIIAAVLEQMTRNQARSESSTQSGADRRRRNRAVETQLRDEASAAAQATRAQTGAKVVGFVKERGGGSMTSESGHAVILEDTAYVQTFESADEADDWFGSLPPGYAYAAYFDASDPTWPRPINEAFGRLEPAAPALTASAGLWPWMALAAGGGAAYAWWRGRKPLSSAARAPAAHATTTSGGAFLPLLAFGAGGAAGWLGHEWWGGHKARIAEAAATAAAAAAANQVPAASSPPPPHDPAAASGWW